jgi:hypothetical protein
MSALITYCTREMVQREMGFADTARLTARVDRACRAARRDIDRLTHRTFYPTLDTRRFDIPNTGTLWLFDHELADTPTSIITGGTTMATTDYILRPESGPPYRWIEIDTSGSVSWTAGDTWQNAISIVGPFGASADSDAAGTITEAMNTSVTTCDVSDSSLVGVGDLLKVDSERMVVTNKTYVDTTVTLSGNIAASKAVTAVAVSSGAGISAGETILVDSERMFVESVSGNTLIVVRGEQGTVLEAHATSDAVYAPRRLTVVRAAAGTTAASHLDNATATRNLPPPLITEGSTALAVNYVQQGSAGYAQVLGSGNQKRDTGNVRDALGGGLSALLETVYAAHGRKARSRAVM